MNKKAYLLIILILSFTFTSLKIGIVYGSDYIEDFESGTVGVFSNENNRNFWSCSDVNPKEGTYSLLMHDTSTSYYDYCYSDDLTFWDTETDSISFWLYIDASSVGWYLFFEKNELRKVLLQFASNGNLYYYDGDIANYVLFDNFPFDTWYLYIIDLDNENNLFSIHIYDSSFSLLNSLIDAKMRTNQADTFRADITFYSPTTEQNTVYIDYVCSPAQELGVEDTYHLNYISSGTNSTNYDITENCNFTSIWDTNSTMNYATFGWNYTGSFVNDTSFDLEGDLTYSLIKSLGGNIFYNNTVIQWCIYTDTLTGETNSTGLQNFTLTYIIESGTGGYSENDLGAYLFVGSLLSIMALAVIIILMGDDKRK